MMREGFFASAHEKMASAAFAEFCRARNITLAVLFGSCATGRVREGSDLDLAVLLAGSAFPLTDLARGELKRNLIRDVATFFQTSRMDLVLFNQASPLLKQEAVKYGKVVFERNPGEFAAFVSLTLRQQTDARLFNRLHKAYIYE